MFVTPEIWTLSCATQMTKLERFYCVYCVPETRDPPSHGRRTGRVSEQDWPTLADFEGSLFFLCAKKELLKLLLS